MHVLRAFKTTSVLTGSNCSNLAFNRVFYKLKSFEKLMIRCVRIDCFNFNYAEHKRRCKPGHEPFHLPKQKSKENERIRLQIKAIRVNVKKGRQFMANSTYYFDFD